MITELYRKYTGYQQRQKRRKTSTITDIKFSNTELEYTTETKYIFQASSEVMYINVTSKSTTNKESIGLMPLQITKQIWKQSKREVAYGVCHRSVISQGMCE